MLVCKYHKDTPGTIGRSATKSIAWPTQELQKVLQEDFRKYMKSLSSPKTVRRPSRRAERHQKCGHEGEVKSRTSLSSEDVI